MKKKIPVYIYEVHLKRGDCVDVETTETASIYVDPATSIRMIQFGQVALFRLMEVIGFIRRCR